MIDIKQLHKEDIFIVNHLAHKIWPITYKDILSKDQLDYMLDWMYSIPTLEDQVQTGYLYYLITFNGEPAGFLGLEPNFPESDNLRVHKIYILTELHGNGLGKKFIEFTEELATSIGMKKLSLTVNRFNNATEFYKHLGFEVMKEEDFKIGKGYLMEDFVMEKSI